METRPEGPAQTIDEFVATVKQRLHTTMPHTSGTRRRLRAARSRYKASPKARKKWKKYKQFSR